MQAQGASCWAPHAWLGGSTDAAVLAIRHCSGFATWPQINTPVALSPHLEDDHHIGGDEQQVAQLAPGQLLVIHKPRVLLQSRGGPDAAGVSEVRRRATGVAACSRLCHTEQTGQVQQATNNNGAHAAGQAGHGLPETAP